MFFRKIGLSFLGILLFSTYSCKPGAPKGVMSAGKMEDVLFDYHLAQGMAQQAPADSADYYTRLYQEAVFKKYDITEKDFDRSMEWYARHTEKLGDIYNTLSERMGSKPTQTVTNSELAAGAQSLSGDSLNFWFGKDYIMLNSKGINRFHFSEKNDTIVNPSDRIQWKFYVNWHYHEGTKHATAMLIVHYEGDSIATNTQGIYGVGPQVMNLRIDDKKVEKVEGFIYQSSPWASRERLMTISKLQLLRIKTHETPQKQEEQIEEPIEAEEVRPRISNSSRHNMLKLDTAQKSTPLRKTLTPKS